MILRYLGLCLSLLQVNTDGLELTGVPGGGLEAMVITVESSARVNIRKNRGQVHLASEMAPAENASLKVA